MILQSTKDYLLLIDEEAEIKKDDTALFKSVWGKEFTIDKFKVFKIIGEDTNNYIVDTKDDNENGDWATISKTDMFKIIAYYPLTKEAKELDLPLLPNPFKEEIDLLSYINKLANQKFDSWSNDEMKGYKTALISIFEFYKEVQSKQFSLEDVKKAIRLARVDDKEDEYISEKEIIQSLSTQQLPKEFIPEGVGEPVVMYKTTINSEGKQELVGTYKY